MRILVIFSTLLFFSLQYGLSQAATGCTAGDCQNGRGRYVYDNGDKFLGEFQNSMPNGRGNYFFQNGNVYQGTFKNGRRHGYGTFKWTTGDVYIGEYVVDQREGEGTYYFANNGGVQHGIWKQGQLVEEQEYKPQALASNDPFSEKQASRSSKETNQVKEQEKQSLEQAEKLNLRLPALQGRIPKERRTALVIGNSLYESKTPLKNANKDARDMAQELRKSGFDVILLTDVKGRDMKAVIRDFGQDLKEKGGIGLFYYAGHGLQADGRNYLVPTDAQIKKEQDIEFESVDLGRLLVELEYAGNNLNIVILDACRDNPYKSEFSEANKNNYNGLAAIGSAPYNSFIAFSTAPGMVSQDGETDNGLYTKQLLKEMQKPKLKIEDIFKNVRREVRKASGGNQIPWELSSVEDDFYFKP